MQPVRRNDKRPWKSITGHLIKRVCLESDVCDWEALRVSGIFFIAEKLRWIALVGARGGEVSMQGVSHGLSHVNTGRARALDYVQGMLFAPQWTLRAVSFGRFRKYRSPFF